MLFWYGIIIKLLFSDFDYKNKFYFAITFQKYIFYIDLLYGALCIIPINVTT